MINKKLLKCGNGFARYDSNKYFLELQIRNYFSPHNSYQNYLSGHNTKPSNNDISIGDFLDYFISAFLYFNDLE